MNKNQHYKHFCVFELPFRRFLFSFFPLFRLVYTLKEKVDLATFVRDPYFTYQKSILGDISTYTCKVLNLASIALAEEGSEVTVFVRHTHKEVPQADIDSWMSLYGTLLNNSRCVSSFSSFLYKLCKFFGRPSFRYSH